MIWLPFFLLACSSPTPDWRQDFAAWKHPDPVPDFPLVDERGRRFTLGRYRGQWLLLGFVFTRCGVQEACPMTMTKMVSIQEKAPPNLRLLAITLDPAHDDPAALAAFGARHGADPRVFTLATGDPELVSEALPAMFNVLSLPSDGTLTHTVKLSLLKPDGTLDHEWKDNEVTVEDVLARVR